MPELRQGDIIIKRADKITANNLESIKTPVLINQVKQ